MQDYLPKKKGDLNAWTTNFITVVTANMTTIGLTSADKEALSVAQTAFGAAIGSVETAKGALKAAVQAEKTSTKTLTGLIRGDVRRIQANPAVTPTLKGQLRINPRTTPRNHTAPVTPTGLTVDGYANGVNSLRWNRAGNKPSAVFQIQAKIGTATDFVGVGNATAAKFDHSGQTPGVKIVYRVVATRAGMNSDPSSAVTVYETGSTGFLTLQKAA